MNNEVRNNNGYLGGFLTGALIGAGIALLYAPRSGKDTREFLCRKTGELKDKAAGILEHGKEVVRDGAEELGREARKVKNQFAQEKV